MLQEIMKKIELINKSIEYNLNESSPKRFNKAADYIVFSNGHRYRSLIGLEIYEIFECDGSEFLESIVGIEFIHHASMICDDLPCMDNAAIRKGKAAVHCVFGEDIAILASLYLWGKGRQLIYDNACKHLRGINEIGEVELIAYNAVNGMLKGQELDLKKEKSEEELIESIYQKNRLFHLACILPAYLLRKKEHLELLSSMGEDLSIGYQLFDDLRDAEENLDKDRKNSVYKFGINRVKQEVIKRKERIIENTRKIKANSELENVIEHIFDSKV